MLLQEKFHCRVVKRRRMIKMMGWLQPERLRKRLDWTLLLLILSPLSNLFCQRYKEKCWMTHVLCEIRIWDCQWRWCYTHYLTDLCLSVTSCSIKLLILEPPSYLYCAIEAEFEYLMWFSWKLSSFSISSMLFTSSCVYTLYGWIIPFFFFLFKVVDA